MQPVVALIGRPNVGKSTLFNVLTKSRNALAIDIPGVTRDRQFGIGRVGPVPYIVVDTGGIGEETTALDDEMSDQSWLAVSESTHILFIVDAKDGLTPGDEEIAQRLHRMGKRCFVVVNKVDGRDADIVTSEFYALNAMGHFAIAASHKRGVTPLMRAVLDDCVLEAEVEAERGPKRTRITLVGRPNVGKSTLVNRMLGEERVVVFDKPGTTRDTIDIDFERHESPYTLVDTAGVRRNKGAMDTLEKFSVVKALQAIEKSHVVILLIDAKAGILAQDLSLIRFVLESGRALVIGINKWDGLTEESKEDIKEDLRRRLRFLDYVRIHFISAKHGTNVGHLWASIDEAYQSATKELSTALLTRILQTAVEEHQPPLVQGRRIKLRYAHCGGRNPPIIVVHGNQTDDLPPSYLKYLENLYRKTLALMGTPVVVRPKTGDNPYAGKRNVLTPRQQRKRNRMVADRKKRDKKK